LSRSARRRDRDGGRRRRTRTAAAATRQEPENQRNQNQCENAGEVAVHSVTPFLAERSRVRGDTSIPCSLRMVKVLPFALADDEDFLVANRLHDAGEFNLRAGGDGQRAFAFQTESAQTRV